MNEQQAKRVQEIIDRCREPNGLNMSTHYVRDVSWLLQWLEQAGEIIDEERVITIKIPVDLEMTSPNNLNGQHWAVLKRLRDQLHTVAAAAWTKAGSPVAAGPVNYKVISRRPGRRLDDGNAMAACKFYEDVLFKNRVTKNDSPKYVRFKGIEQENGSIWKGREEMEFRIWPAT